MRLIGVSSPPDLPVEEIETALNSNTIIMPYTPDDAS
jgi:hypothetical protein